jgi:hypothetical protein
MCLLVRDLVVFSLLATLVVGCNDVTEHRTYSLSVTESGGLLSTGAQICELGNGSNCEETDELGEATISVPPDREVAFTIEKSGYGPLLIADVSDERFGQNADGTGRGIFRIYPVEELQLIASSLGVQYPWEEGVVVLRVALPRPFPGVVFRPLGSTADAVGASFYYDANAEEYTRDLEETTRVSTGHLLPLAEGGFTEVSPGDHRFEFAGTGAACSVPSWGWPVEDQPNAVRLPVRAGYTTYASMNCE